MDEHKTPIHQPMAPKSGSWHSNMTRHVPLTAHVLLTLIKVGFIIIIIIIIIIIVNMLLWLTFTI